MHDRSTIYEIPSECGCEQSWMFVMDEYRSIWIGLHRREHGFVGGRRPDCRVLFVAVRRIVAAIGQSAAVVARARFLLVLHAPVLKPA